MVQNSRWLLLWVSGFLFTCESDPTLPNDGGFTCTSDAECQTGFYCQNGACVVKPPCTDLDGDQYCDKREGFDDCNDNQADIHPGAEEACDEQDNDCDSETDEGCPCRKGESQPCGTDTGACKRGTQLCADGQWGACNGGRPPADRETCDNGLDDDCDGALDNGCPCLQSNSRSCGLALGLCKPGAQLCEEVGGSWVWGACRGGTAPEDEACDGLDNDCDGAIDNGCACAEKSRRCGLNRGTCYAGTQTCVGGKWGGCDGAVGPADEICDGLDNDCDDQTDEIGCECQSGQKQACGKELGECRQGSVTCVNGYWGPCEGATGPTPERCDGRDNDCDGAYDEDFPLLSERCTAGQGICLRTGAWVCSPDGSSAFCNAPVVTVGTTEVCNGVDDDCDGATDEGFEGVGTACEIGQGECHALGMTVCDLIGGLRCDALFISPKPEFCDGKDNDCDGQIDEEFNMLGQACAVGIGACRTQGVWICAPGGLVACSAVPGQASPEACNGIDDDCDGRTDEEWVEGCTTACGTGYRFCEAGQPGACSGPQASEEICDSIDNDCDGQTDEGFDAGTRCSAGVGLCRAEGYKVCAPDGRATVCNAVPGMPQIESDDYVGYTCMDGVDNDCDSATDAPDCPGCPQPENTAERCADGIDNNCNGQIDSNDATCSCSALALENMLPLQFLGFGLGLVIFRRRRRGGV